MAATVLVVDDDPIIMEMVAQALEDAGYRVLTAVDGEAVTVAQQQHPNVVLLDLMMPAMDGIEVSQRLRHNTRTKSIFQNLDHR
jgi:CheY-like chemotaxis protein